MRIISILFVPAFGLGLLGWLLFNQLEMNLRTRVAALGVDAEAWEAPLMAQRGRLIWRVLIIAVTVFVLLVLAGALIHNITRQAEQAAISQRSSLNLRQQVREGMTEAEVTQAIGRPSTVQTGSDPDYRMMFFPTADDTVALVMHREVEEGPRGPGWYVSDIQSQPRP